MAKSNIISNPIFHDADKARMWLEARIWKDGRVCPHCGVVDQSTLMQGKTTRPGLYQCNACREPFTVTVGTLYERSKVPVNKWLAATHLMMASKKGMSALEIGRLLGLSKKTAWFVCHRIRESLRENNPALLGGPNKVVEGDESYVGGKAKNRKGKIPSKEAVFALVERDGKVRSRHVPDVTGKTLGEAIRAQVNSQTYLMTDEAPVYASIARDLVKGHGRVNHSIEEYVRGGFWHTNTIENYFSIMKRGVIGTYHHVSPQHLKRYLAEFDFRYNERESLGVDDEQRMAKAIPGIVGKRLTYRRTCSEQAA